MAIYVKYGDIKGDATHHNHKGSDGWWIAHSCNFSVSRGIGGGAGSQVDRNSSTAHVSEISVNKTGNNASHAFYKEATVGKACDCVIEYVMDGAGHGETYMQLKLTEAMISHWSSHSGGDRPHESISINFTKLEVKSMDHDSKGKMVTSKGYTFDIAQGKIV